MEYARSDNYCEERESNRVRYQALKEDGAFGAYAICDGIEFDTLRDLEWYIKLKEKVKADADREKQKKEVQEHTKHMKLVLSSSQEFPPLGK